MNSKLKFALIALAVIVVLALGIWIISSLAGGEDAPPESAAPTQVPASETPAASPSSEPEPDESAAPAELTTATLAIGGDIVMHSGLNSEAASGGNGYDYEPIFGVLPDLIAGADYAACSLVTSLPGSGSIVDAVSAVGFDLVNTATSHLADSWKTGIDHALDVLDAAGLAHVGTYRSEDERASSGNRVMADVGGISVAFLAYTCDTNSIPVSGFEYAASICARDYLSGGRDIDYELMSSDVAAAREAGAEAVVVFMSWGEELSTTPNDLQREIADSLIASGADVIIGGRCRVPQPMETRTVVLEDGGERTGFVCYSLGNLLSCQNDEYTDISAILNIELSRNDESGETEVSGVSYRPIYMADLYDYGINDFEWHYRVVDLHNAIDAWESGEPWEFMTEDVYTDMVIALDAAHELFGAAYDPLYTGE